MSMKEVTKKDQYTQLGPDSLDQFVFQYDLRYHSKKKLSRQNVFREEKKVSNIYQNTDLNVTKTETSLPKNPYKKLKISNLSGASRADRERLDGKITKKMPFEEIKEDDDERFVVKETGTIFERCFRKTSFNQNEYLSTISSMDSSEKELQSQRFDEKLKDRNPMSTDSSNSQKKVENFLQFDRLSIEDLDLLKSGKK